MHRTIAILGAGFGGLRAAKILGKKVKIAGLKDECDIILIDKNSYHTYTPTLYEIATTSKETGSDLDLKQIVTFPLGTLLAGLPVKIITGLVNSVNFEEAKISLSNGTEIKYDYLIIALGSESNDFGIPGIKEFSFELKSFDDAIKLRDAIIAKNAEKNASGNGPARNATRSDAGGHSDKGESIKIVVGGGGSTGVELTGEIQEWLCDWDGKTKKCEAEVTIVEAAPGILGSFGPKIAGPAESRLLALGTKIMTGEAITEVTSTEIKLKSGKNLPYDIFIWTGGVKAPAVLDKFPLNRDRKGKILADDCMNCALTLAETKNYKIYGLGDSVSFLDKKTGKPIPGVAHAAILEADVVAHNIMEDLKADLGRGKTKYRAYRPKDYPYILPVGGKWAIAKFGSIVIEGRLAWILKGLVELNYLVSIMPYFKALGTWFSGLRIFIQNDRLG